MKLKQFAYAGCRVADKDSKILLYAYIEFSVDDPLGIGELSEIKYVPEPYSKRHKVGRVYWIEIDEATGQSRAVSKSKSSLHKDVHAIFKTLDRLHWLQFIANSMPHFIRALGRTPIDRAALALAMPKAVRSEYMQELLKLD